MSNGTRIVCRDCGVSFDVWEEIEKCESAEVFHNYSGLHNNRCMACFLGVGLNDDKELRDE